MNEKESGELGNTVGELTEGMLDMIDTLEEERDENER